MEMLGNTFLSKSTFKTNSFKNTIRVSRSIPIDVISMQQMSHLPTSHLGQMKNKCVLGNRTKKFSLGRHTYFFSYFFLYSEKI